MQVLLFIVTLLSPLAQSIDLSDHTGNWNYTVVAPDMTYKGVLALTEADDEYQGTMCRRVRDESHCYSSRIDSVSRRFF